MWVYDSFLRHHLPKTKENNYSASQNLDCSKKGLRKFVNNKKKCWNSGGLTTWTLPIFRVKYTASEFGKHTSFTLQGDAHYTNLLKKTKKWVEKLETNPSELMKSSKRL